MLINAIVDVSTTCDEHNEIEILNTFVGLRWMLAVNIFPEAAKPNRIFEWNN